MAKTSWCKKNLDKTREPKNGKKKKNNMEKDRTSSNMPTVSSTIWMKLCYHTGGTISSESGRGRVEKEGGMVLGGGGRLNQTEG